MGDLCKSKYSVRIAKYESDLVSLLKEYYDGTDVRELRVNIDFIRHICDCIEWKFTKDKKRYKMDKKKIALSIIKKLVGDISDIDTRTIETIIESLHSSGLISGKTVYKCTKGVVKNILKKVLLMD